MTNDFFTVIRLWQIKILTSGFFIASRSRPSLKPNKFGWAGATFLFINLERILLKQLERIKILFLI